MFCLWAGFSTRIVRSCRAALLHGRGRGHGRGRRLPPHAKGPPAAHPQLLQLCLQPCHQRGGLVHSLRARAQAGGRVGGAGQDFMGITLHTATRTRARPRGSCEPRAKKWGWGGGKHQRRDCAVLRTARREAAEAPRLLAFAISSRACPRPPASLTPQHRSAERSVDTTLQVFSPASAHNEIRKSRFVASRP